MFVASGYESGYIVNYTGIVVGDSPTDLVYLRSAAPVGAVHPFAGATSGVPYGWFVCDGSAKSKEEWPDLFDAIGNIHHADATVGSDPDSMVIVGDTRGIQVGDAIRVVWAIGEVSTTVISVDPTTRVVSIANNAFADLPEGTELRVYGRVVGSTVGRSIYFLPDLRRRTVFGTSFGTGLPGSGIISPQLGIASVGGDDEVELAINNIPDHRHSLDVNVLSSTVGGYASSTDQTGDMIELGSNGSPFSIMPHHISMHWIIRAKKGFQATILTGHNHDNFYIRYDVPHTLPGGAARTLTEADRIQFRANARVLRNDADDTFNGTLTVTGNVIINGLGGDDTDLTVAGGVSSDFLVSNRGFFNQSLAVNGEASFNISNNKRFSVLGGSASSAFMSPIRNIGLSGTQYDQNSVSPNSRNVVVDRVSGELSCRPLYRISTTRPSASIANQYPEGFVWYTTSTQVDTNPGPKFITPVTIPGVSPNAFNNLEVFLGAPIFSEIPASATALIIDGSISINSPDNTPIVATYSASTSTASAAPRYTIIGGRSAGSNDQAGCAGQTTIPFDRINRKIYLHLNLTYNGSATLRIVGYY
jgi:microcystin-dependent protein